jgi:hypothetical protein
MWRGFVMRRFGLSQLVFFISTGLLPTAGLTHADAAVLIQKLQVEYRDTPLGIDVARPRFN